MMAGKIVCIEGGIGVGKTILCKSMVADLRKRGIPAEFIEEQNDEYLIQKFTTEPGVVALTFQYTMMAKRITGLLKAHDAVKRGNVVILDTGILRDLAFSKANYQSNNMSADQYMAFLGSHKQLVDSIDIKPDMIILLDSKDVSVCLNNIRTRNRLNESDLPVKYLECVMKCHKEALYDELLKDHASKHIKKLIIDVTDKFADAAIVNDQILAH
jgi:deoxyadenosine/deoxycytidine kinase